MAATSLVVDGGTSSPGPASSETSSRTGAVEPSAGDSESWSVRADGVYAEWAGSYVERQAAEVVVAHALNGEYELCMADEGYSRPWEAAVFPVGGFDSPLGATLWAAGRLDGRYSQMRIEAAQSWRIEQTLNAVNAVNAVGAEAESEVTCREKNPGASDESVNAIRDPEVVKNLLEAWSEVMIEVYIVGGEYDFYEDCMRDSGVLDQLEVESSSQAKTLLATPPAPGSVRLEGMTSTQKWTAYLEQEATYVNADWNCRKDIRAKLGAEVEAALDTFEAENAEQVSVAREHWESTWREAIDLGWTNE